jgi:ATP-dependent DNA helicase RecG
MAIQRGRPAGPARIALDTPVMYLKGVGPARAEALRRLGIVTAGDLLYHAPHRYEDASTVAPIASLEPGMQATIIGRVISKGVLPTRKGLRIFQAVVRDASGLIEAAWPGQPYLDRTIEKGDVLLLSGQVRFFHGRQLLPREMVNLGDEDEGTASGRVLSVYPATEGLSFKVIRGLLDAHLDTLLPLVTETLPPDVLAPARVPPLPEALRMVHRPASLGEAMNGRARLAYEELLFVQILQRRANAIARSERRGITFENKRLLTSQLRKSLPWELTGAQMRALREIVGDMTSPRRMHRLLQGDVGSGKTIVALFAALLAIENGWQAAVMAPTELLAEQHFRTMSRLLAPLGSEPVLLTGSLSAPERRAALARIAGGEPLLAIGTHALVQEGAVFGKLGFVAIDEQHRFGVEQRKALMSKGEAPDTLLMTATPIPRSLALTMYGDLDVSILDERPPGRQPIATALRGESHRPRIMEFVEREVAKGRQAYIVYPLVEESEKVDLKNATEEYERLRKESPELRVGLVHGQMHGDDKDAVMRAFAAGEVDVLVSTTVIEVGIDVPNATVMVVEHAERFGLSQLHQLRGRVGRGAEESFCILLAGGGEARERLKLFASTEDGFKIAEFDMQQRGYGDLFGARQTGIPDLRFADLAKDFQLLGRARTEARQIVDTDPELKAHPQLRRVLQERYGERAKMYHVG